MRSRPRRGVRGRNERAPPPARRSLADRFRRPRPRRTAHRRQSRARRPAPGATLAARLGAPEARSRLPPARAGSTFRSAPRTSSCPRRWSAPPARNPSPTAPSASPGVHRRRVERFGASSRRRSAGARGRPARQISAPDPRRDAFHTCPVRGDRAPRRGADGQPVGSRQGPDVLNCHRSLFSAPRARRFGSPGPYEAFTGCAQVCCVRRYRACLERRRPSRARATYLSS